MIPSSINCQNGVTRSNMVTTVRTQSTRADVRELVRRLPAILSGRVPDVGGVGAGFRARVTFALMGLVAERFKKMGRGGTDITGDKWAELTPAYLAYGRPIAGRNRRLPSGRRVPVGGGKAGGSGNDGLLTAKQDKQWWKAYKRNLAFLATRHPLGKAKGIAAARAWIEVKGSGGKTKIADPRFGGRRLGDYQILKSDGILEASLTQGELSELGAGADYSPPEGQVVEDRPGQVIISTNVPYAGAHHFGKGRSRRLLWPEPIPDSWWDEVLGVAVTGLERIADLFKRGAIT